MSSLSLIHILTPGGIPAIVDQDLFDRVQQRFEQNRIAHGRPAKEDVSYLLTTKQRLDELEAQKEALDTSILEEELKKPVLTREWIRFWLETVSYTHLRRYLLRRTTYL